MQALIRSFARTEDRMRTYLQSKGMAKSLRDELATKNISLSHRTKTRSACARAGHRGAMCGRDHFRWSRMPRSAGRA
jgi:hypothetical protein